MSAAEQGCTLCDDLTTLVASSELEITELYRDLETPNPAALLAHAKKHSHPDLGSLTYHGSRIVAVAEPHPIGDTPSAASVTPIGVHAGDVTIDPPQSALAPPPPSEPSEDGFVAVDPTTRARVQGLADTHTSGRVRDVAGQLLAAIDEHEGRHFDRIRLEQLVAQRDQLTDEIAALEARLNPPTDDAPTVDLGQVRRWAREQGYAVSDRGRVLPKVVADYLRVHGGEVS